MDGPEGGAELFLVVEACEAAADRLSAAFAAGPIPSVLIIPPAGQALNAATAGPLIQLVQSHGAAALLLDDFGLAQQLGADGVHLSHSKDIESRYRDARQTIGRTGIVGFDSGHSRHDAMTVAEAGADYVAFGIPASVQNLDIARERRLDLIAWWAEIFEVPCVALDVETPELAAALAEAGADFIGVKIEAGTPPAHVARRIASFAERIQLAVAQ
ncbi:MAG: thiamine phosphate synthase [Pseudomonadota bacterium]|mgnify:CR=1 FL=1|jgi:thiamine-phosphate pyrophosphorylase|nr:MAG: thiamine phosphate synthase [Pseudomonadota bacterium]